MNPESETIFYSTHRWNLSRSIASDVVDVIEKSRESPDECGVLAFDGDCEVLSEQFDEYDTERDVWPFESAMKLVEFVRQVCDSLSSVTTDDVARGVSKRIAESDAYKHTSEQTQEEQEDGDEQNDEERNGVDDAESGDESGGEDDERADQSSGSDTLSVEEINAQFGNGEDDTPTFNNKVNSNTSTDDPDLDKDGSEGGIDVTVSEQAETIAERLYECFVVGDDVRYSELVDEFDVKLPHREVAVVETVNSRGSTRDERVADLAEWVQWVIDNPEEITYIESHKPNPMGLSEPGD